LLREQRLELQAVLQQVFEKLNFRQDEERGSFTKEASENYKRLKILVSKGLAQAEETHEYKDTREFLKKIQSEFKGIKMIKEEREELYTRLQTAFEILNTRVDEYFHTKKKNWEVRMQYKLAETNTEIHQLKTEIEKDLENLSELEDHLDILVSSGKDSTAKTGIEARIISARSGIEKKKREIEKLETEMNELKNRIDPED
jgi:predicted  nucleic acid-binding Zn-ribbon protein